nr:sugar carrier protein C-like [Ipomoea batatas]
MAFFFNGGIRLPFADAEFRARIPAILRWIAAASGGMMCGYSQQILGGLLSMPIFLNKLSRAWYLRQEMSDSTNFCDAQSVGMIYFSTLFTFGTCVGGFLGLVMHSRRWPRFTSFLGAVLVLGGAVTSAARVDPFPITSTLLFLLIGTGIGMTRVGIPVLLLRISPDHARDSLDRVIVLVFLLALILVGRINARDTTEPYRPIRVLMREHRPLVIFRVGFGILPQLLGLGSLVLVPFAFESINFGANDLPFTALVVWGALAFVITTISSVYVIPRFGRRGTIFLSLLAFALSQVSLGPVLRHAGNARNGILRSSTDKGCLLGKRSAHWTTEICCTEEPSVTCLFEKTAPRSSGQPGRTSGSSFINCEIEVEAASSSSTGTKAIELSSLLSLEGSSVDDWNVKSNDAVTSLRNFDECPSEELPALTIQLNAHHHGATSFSGGEDRLKLGHYFTIEFPTTLPPPNFMWKTGQYKEEGALH